MTEFEKMVQLLDMSWYLRDEIVPCLVGPPGIGKTAAVEQHAKAHGSKVVKIVASRCIPSETVGMTMPNHERRSMDIYNSAQLSSLRDGDILFLDELLEAEQFVLSTLLTLIESREMADGTPLPDIQIIAATNDTIPPEQLKGNIRQRFMFQRFNVDKTQTKDYIAEKTGMLLGDDVMTGLCGDGSDYNFLTPRSLTKLCLWMNSVPEDEVSNLACVIDDMWKTTIGFEISKARRMRDARIKSPEQQVRDALITMSKELPIEGVDKFEDCTLGEMLELLKGQSDWEEIASRLSGLQIEDVPDEEVDIRF